MDPFVISLDAIYKSSIGRDAVFSAIVGETLRVVDKTAGDEVQPLNPGVALATVVPAIRVRRYELTEKGLTDLVDLVDTTVTFNGTAWTIKNYKSVPAPGGEATGEVRLTLRKP